jgi:hypothetical protein
MGEDWRVSLNGRGLGSSLSLWVIVMGEDSRVCQCGGRGSGCESSKVIVMGAVLSLVSLGRARARRPVTIRLWTYTTALAVLLDPNGFLSFSQSEKETIHVIRRFFAPWHSQVANYSHIPTDARYNLWDQWDEHLSAGRSGPSPMAA